jgi:Asp-tRNA(Asn)/Glu-tRNA(Gln) amidotransferase B subunit
MKEITIEDVLKKHCPLVYGTMLDSIKAAMQEWSSIKQIEKNNHIQGIEKTLKENEKRIAELKKGLGELSNIPLGTWIKDVREKAKQLLK